MSQSFEKIDDDSFRKIEVKTEETVYTVSQIKTEIENADREIKDYETALQSSKDKKTNWELLLLKAQELSIPIEEIVEAADASAIIEAAEGVE